MADFFDTTSNHTGGSYDAYEVPDPQGRTWKIVYDSSILCQRTQDGQRISTSDLYAVELVSPICGYEDIKTIQEIIRRLRTAGALANSSTGIHIHVNAAPIDARTLRNLVNRLSKGEYDFSSSTG